MLVSDPATLRREAERALREGRIEDGISLYTRLLAAAPDGPDDWFNLAWLQRAARHFEDALGSYAQALARGIADPEAVHVNRAVILADHLERAAEAEAELGLAIAANPRFAFAWHNLGSLHEDWGDPARARDAYAEVLAIEPGNGRAHARLAAIDVFEGRAAEVVARLRPLLADPLLPRDDATDIAFALGNALDAAGLYDEAFAIAGEANRAVRDAIPPAARYDRAVHERLIDALIAVFPLPAAPPPSEARAPIFICGMFRSGSTLAEQILARHSHVTAGGELEMLPALVRQVRPYPAALTDASPDRLADLRDTYLAEIAKLFPNAATLTDKRPDNFLHIGLIKTLFPGARIVHTRRDALDNLLSIHFLYFDPSISYGFDLADSAHWHAQYLRLMAHWSALYGADIHEFDYDALVRDPRGEVAGLLDFCGLPWEEACLVTDAAPRAVRTASVWQVRQPLHTRSSGRRRHYAARLREALGEIEL